MPRLIAAITIAVLFGAPALAAAPSSGAGLHVVSAETGTGEPADDAVFGRGRDDGVAAAFASPPETGLPLTR